MNFNDPKMKWLLEYEKALVSYFGSYAKLPNNGVYWNHGHMAYGMDQKPQEAAEGYLRCSRYSYLLKSK